MPNKPEEDKTVFDNFKSAFTAEKPTPEDITVATVAIGIATFLLMRFGASEKAVALARRILGRRGPRT